MNARTSSVSEKEIDKRHSLVVQPNPASEYVEVYLPESFTTDNSIILYNTMGKIVKEVSLNSNIQSTGDNTTMRVPLRGLSSGMYYIAYTSEDVTFTTPLLILR